LDHSSLPSDDKPESISGNILVLLAHCISRQL